MYSVHTYYIIVCILCIHTMIYIKMAHEMNTPKAIQVLHHQVVISAIIKVTVHK